MTLSSNRIPFLAPYFVEVQRQSFLQFLQIGLISELSKRNFFHIPHKNCHLIFYPEYYQLNIPEYTPKQAILKAKTYGSKLYIPLQITNYKTKQLKLHWVTIGNIPLMTKRGHFIINGSPRVIVNQIVRSPGIYYRELVDREKNKRYYADLISNRGAWLRFEIDKKKRVWVRMKKARRLPILIFLKAVGISDFRLKTSLKYPEFLELSKFETEEIETENYFHPESIEDSTIRLYELAYPFKILKEDPSVQITTIATFDKARKFFFRKFFSHRTYDLSHVGRTHLNKKFQVNISPTTYVLTTSDLLCATDHLVKLHHGIGIIDDIDHLKNRRVRASGELIQNQVGTGCIRLAKFIKEKITNINVSISTIISTKPLNGALREFFGSSPLSQFMDQTNPLAELTHKRRISSLGPGGITRETAGMPIRGIHPTYYGRICPIETPEGRNAGLVSSLTIFSRLNHEGFIETPFYSVYQGQIQKFRNINFLSAAQEQDITIAPGDLKTNYFHFLSSMSIPVRKNNEFRKLSTNQVKYISVSPLQMISIATSLIPFLEHDDANRALMGSNMQRQAVPLLLPEKPIVGTGLESRIISDSGHGIQTEKSGFVSYVSNETIQITYFLSKFLQVSDKETRLLRNFKEPGQSLLNKQNQCKFNKKKSVQFLVNQHNQFKFSKKEKTAKSNFTKIFPNFFNKNQFSKFEKFENEAFKFKKLGSNFVELTKPVKAIKQTKKIQNSGSSQPTSNILNSQFNSISSQKTKAQLITQPVKIRVKQKCILPFYKTTNRLNYLAYTNSKNYQTSLPNNFLYLSELIVDKVSSKMYTSFCFNLPKNKTFFKFKLEKSNQVYRLYNLKKTAKREQYSSKIHFFTFSENAKKMYFISTQNKSTKSDFFFSLENKVIEFSKLILNYTFLQEKNLKHIFFYISSAWNTIQTSTFSQLEPHKKSSIFFTNHPYINNYSSLTNNSYLIKNSFSKTSNKTIRKNTQLKVRQNSVWSFATNQNRLIQQNTNSTSYKIPKVNLFSETDKVYNQSKSVTKIPLQHIHFETFKNKIKNLTFLSELNFSKKIENKNYFLQPYQHSNQNTCMHQRPIVQEGDWVQKGDLLADGAASVHGEVALGKTIVVAYMPWEGYNFEDAILLSQRLIYDDLYTSVHIEKHEIEISYTQHGVEEITPILTDVPKYQLDPLDYQGIIKLGTWVNQGDILVGKTTPIKPKQLSGYEKLIAAVLGKKTVSTHRDTSLRVPKNVSGRVIHIEILETENIPEGVSFSGPGKVHVYIAEKRNIQVGDKMSGRHGNKGIVSKIVPRQDMPYLPDGTPVDMVLNPLGVPSRMNVGQIFECLLGFAGKELHEQYKIRCFDEMNGPEASRSLTYSKLFEARIKTHKKWLFNPNYPGKMKLFDGRTGESFHQTVTVGQSYILKLVHLVDDKIHARSTGPYSLVTQQPLRGRSKHGGQRVGEMEVWAFEGFGAAYILQEILTIKSDDIQGRHQVMQSILENKSVTFGTPESFRVLVSELQSLCLNIGVYSVTNAGIRTKIDSMQLS